ncbi:MAG TPA: VCBS repeat-containing protein [Thermoanaerobaculia bacterium]|nr:VCBS repeat-containing protein [Thermoanaerobaculia bacterium]
MQTLAGFLFAVFLANGQQPGGPPQAMPPARCGYPDPPACFMPMGYFTGGIALVDLNKDGFEDAVLANGIDASPQPLVVQYGSERGFATWPDWYSDEINFMGDLAIGDINGDGWVDVAVAVLMSLDRNTGAGGVNIYFNQGGTLEPTASYQTAGGYLTLGCTLGDVDADGDLDLVVPVVAEGSSILTSSIWRAPVQGLQDGRARIYLNRDGLLDEYPSWIAARPSRPGDALVADINQDGWMDLALSGSTTQIFYGKDPNGSPEVPLPTVPNWESKDIHCYSYSLDAGYPGKSPGQEPARFPSHTELMVAVSSGCLSGQNPKDCGTCRSRYFVYQPRGQTTPVWTSNEVHLAAKLLLADLDGSGYLDLVADQWGKEFAGAPLSLYMAQQHQGPPFAKQPTCLLGKNRIGEGLAVADLRKSCPRELTYKARATTKAAVVTLPQRRIQAIKEVIKEDRVLASSQFIWTPESNWISLSQPLLPGETIQATYQFSDCLDIAEATFQPQHGSFIFYQGENPNQCSLLGIPTTFP